MKGFYIHTFGCQMNQHDSEKMAGNLSLHGYQAVDSPAQADVVLVNTCYVRERAMTKVYAYLGRLKALKNGNPHLVLAVCGCGAQGEGKKLLDRMPWLDLVVGPGEMHRIGELVQQRYAQNEEGKLQLELETDCWTTPNLAAPQRADGIKAWVTIMEGCDNFCSYCVVPYVRGREKSRDPHQILAEINTLEAQGYKEITLLGQNVNSYRSASKEAPDFPALLRFITRHSSIPRIRFVTSHPKDLSDQLIEVMACQPALCEFLHLPVQSGSNRILAQMNRRYTVERYAELIEKIRGAIPEMVFTTDIIVGFPGETVQEFEETVALVQWAQFSLAYVFYYQPRPGTAAAKRADDVPYKEKIRRLQKIVTMQKEITLRQHRALVGRKVELLVEAPSKRGETSMMGRTRGNHIVHYHGNTLEAGSFVTVEVTEAYAHSLKGEPVSEGISAVS